MLYWIAWLTDFAVVLFIFAGTRFLAEQNASPTLLGMLGASFFFASAISNASAGHVSDRIGRRRVPLCGMTLFLISLGTVALVSPPNPLFYTSYTVVGVSVGLIYPPIMASLGHGKDKQASRRAYLWFCLAFNLGLTTGQLSGGWMFEQINPRAPLWCAMGLAFLGLLSLFGLKEPVATLDADEAPQLSPQYRVARAFTRLNWIANFGGMFSMSILWFLLPVLVVELKVSPLAHGSVLAIGRIVVMMTYCVMYLQPFWQFRFRTVVGAQSLAHSRLELSG